jgi:outer membrane murein-binding lipoprotein Lpp
MKTNVFLILLTVAACVLASIAFVRVGQLETDLANVKASISELSEDRDQTRDILDQAGLLK